MTGWQRFGRALLKVAGVIVLVVCTAVLILVAFTQAAEQASKGASK